MPSLKVVPLQQIVASYPAISERLIQERANVVCRNRTSGEVRRRQFRALYQANPRFWQNSTTWEYFLERETLERILPDRSARSNRTQSASGDARDVSVSAATAAASPEEPSPAATPAASREEPSPAATPAAAPTRNFGAEYERIERLDPQSRSGLLKRSGERLELLVAADEAEPETVAAALVETTSDAALANRATLLEALRLGDEEARAYTQQMVVETHQVVRSTIRLVDSSIYNDDLVTRVIERSNGTVVQHMTRVFLRGLEFMLYYNRQVMTRGIGNRIRVGFVDRYRDFYRALLPHLHPESLTLERVFLGGMKSLSEVELNKFATGFLVHDIGKAEDIEYHEGEAGYDRETVVRHVKIGYRAVMEKTNYPREAGLITGYHHEYYGDPSGYGYFREFLQAYREAKPSARQDYIMAFTIEPVIDYEVLAYFPAKMLEIVDVFDSLTDANRRYRAALSTDEALELMRDEFVERKLKLDPILFDLFVEFVDTRRGAQRQLPSTSPSK